MPGPCRGCASATGLSAVSPQPREKGRMRFHKLQNVQIALNYLKHRQVRGGLGGLVLLGPPSATTASPQPRVLHR